MPYAVPIDQMPGQQRAQGAGAAGDQDGAPAEGAVRRRPGSGREPRDTQKAVPDGQLGLARAEGGGQQP